MQTARIHLLVVDDERGLCAGIQEALQREGYAVDAVNDSRVALKRLDERPYNLVLTDVKMPGLSGVELLREARRRNPGALFIVMTAFGTVENAVEAMREGAYDYLTKPLEMRRLRAVVRKALEFQGLMSENVALRRRLRQRDEPNLLASESEAMRRALRTAEEVARSDVTVLIEGESGTGKELVAGFIHQRSPRADKPLVSVNCAALPESLVEAELFGHKKGAFTGAMADKPGRFQLADEGTLFLDEIGDLPPKGQGDLLRVLEDGAFAMVGGTDLVRVDVRVVAATNKKLAAEVAAGRFREDLYYRLQVVPITIPPLRERAEDVPLLIKAFLDHFSARHQNGRKQLAAEAMQLCQRFPWPGNVRQLRNVIERLVLTAPGPVIGVDQLPDFLRAHDLQATSFTLRAGMTIAEVEKLLIQQTLSRVTSHREDAARLLGISRRALQYKLKQYGLTER